MQAILAVIIFLLLVKLFMGHMFLVLGLVAAVAYYWHRYSKHKGG